MNFASQIKAMLDTKDVFIKYGFEPDAKGFVCCPFHHEKTASMKIYTGDKGYYCFGCGCSGDIFDFVKNIFNINFAESQIKLNNDFGLNLPIGEKLDRRKQIQIAKEQFKKKQEQSAKKKQLEELENAVDSALDEFAKYDKNKQTYKPIQKDTELHPLFVEAIKNFEQAKYKLECAEIDLCLFKNGIIPNKQIII